MPERGLKGSKGSRNEAALKISFFPINVDNSEGRCCRQLLFEMMLRKVGVVQFSFLFWRLPDQALDFFYLWEGHLGTGQCSELLFLGLD